MKPSADARVMTKLALAEPVIDAARKADAAYVAFSEHGCHDARLITALYARLDDLNTALKALPE